MPVELKRKFEVTDPEMILAAEVMKEFFHEDKGEFIAFDADFTDPFEDDWQTAIDAATVQPDDETIVDQISQKTAEVEAAMRTCTDKYQATKYFIEKAFPGNRAVWNEFGYNDYAVASRSQSKLHIFMIKFHSIAEKYHTQLIAAGYLQAKIDEIETFANLLKDKNVSQEVEKGGRYVATQDRITVMNACWEPMAAVAKAGKAIYYNNYAKFQHYILPASDENSEALNIKGTVKNAAGGAVIAGALVRIISLGIETLTDSHGRFVFGGLAAGPYLLNVTKDGFTEAAQDVTIVEGELLQPVIELTAL